MDVFVLMVAIDNKTGEEMYVSVEFDVGTQEPPRNNPEDIRKVVEICNRGYKEPWTYIDIFGIIIDGRFEQWEYEDE